VTGKLPVYGNSTEAMLHALLHDSPLRLRDLAQKAPRDLDVVVAKLLQKDPRDRYQDGEALALDLIRIAEGEPVRIRRQSLAVRIYRRVKRNPIVAVIVVVLLVLLIVTSLWFREALLGDRLEREKNGREHLRRASIAVASERGSPVGPFGLLDALSGARTPEVIVSTGFGAEIDAASRMLPEEEATIVGYQDAYAGRALRVAGAVDPVSNLQVGNGVGALSVITESIDAIKAKYNADDLGERMDRYNLHLASAIANLSASVANPQEALNDLNLANFIRSGAELPRMLQAFLTWKDRSQPKQLLEALEEFMNESKPALRRATAEFLLSFAGICPPGDSHLMRFAMGHATRKILSDKALELLGLPDTPRQPWYFGIERRLAGHATTILNNLGSSTAMGQPLRDGRALLRGSVAASSPIKAWTYTFDLLEDEPKKSSGLSDEHRLWGAIHYVRVVQHALSFDDAALVLGNVEPVVARLLKLAESPQQELREPALELSARLQAWIGGPKVAEGAVDAWLKINDQDPAAQLCKFCALVRAAPKTEEDYLRALRHGLNAISYASDGVQAAVRRSLTKRISHEVANLRLPAARVFLERLLAGLGRSRP
jgi:hypothetical protein